MFPSSDEAYKNTPPKQRKVPEEDIPPTHDGPDTPRDVEPGSDADRTDEDFHVPSNLDGSR